MLRYEFPLAHSSSRLPLRRDRCHPSHCLTRHLQWRRAFGANNVRSGTGVVSAAKRSSLRRRTQNWSGAVGRLLLFANGGFVDLSTTTTTGHRIRGFWRLRPAGTQRPHRHPGSPLRHLLTPVLRRGGDHTRAPQADPGRFSRVSSGRSSPTPPSVGGRRVCGSCSSS